MLFLLQSLNGTSEINTILNEIRNQLGGTVLEYLFDIQEDCFDVLEEVLTMLPLEPHLLVALGIDSLAQADPSKLTPHQRYALMKLLPKDSEDHTTLIDQIRASDVVHYEELKKKIKGGGMYYDLLS